MKLIRSEIENFRSIASLTVNFDPKCRILIGINESGKSNILKALHLLDTEVKVQPADLRIERLDEEQVTSGYVRFVFDPSEEEATVISEELKKSFDPGTIDKPLFQNGNTTITATEWMSSKHQGLHIVMLPSGKRRNTSWGAPNTTKMAPSWYRNNSDQSVDVPTATGAITLLAKCFAWIENPTMPLRTEIEAATPAQIYQLTSAAVGNLLGQRLPKCIFWKYSDQYLLPSSVDINSFCSNPNTCVPLKSMFELAGYDINNLLTIINSARQQGQYRYSQILEKTASAATKHIRTVWKDYDTVRLKLESNGDSLAPMVVDEHVPLDMINRSDGFKRFVSFLLQVSAKVRTDELKDALILVDEPEIALHPSGCRHLLEELIKIGESNATVFSTHSIFMVDKDNIKRHLIVEKKNEVTGVWQAEKSRIQDEEVLYSAMGYSVFETLKPRNLIFEGWRDKYIYDIAKSALIKKDAELKARLASVGSTHANGVKDIRNVARFMELAARPCLIISDADNAALQHKNQYDEPGSWGTWMTLQDIFGPGSIVTAEDLITTSAIVKRANKFRPLIPTLPPLTEDMFDAGTPTMDTLVKWLQSSGLNGTALSDARDNLKQGLFAELKRGELKDQCDRLVQFVDEFKFD